MSDTQARTIQQLTFEVRYSRAPLLWDNAGKIWNEIQNNFFSSEAKHVSPQSVKYTLDDDFQVSIDIDKAFVMWFNNDKTIEDFYYLADHVLSVTKKYLDVKEFSRVGARFIFLEPVESVQNAMKTLIEDEVIVDRSGDYFNVKGKLTESEFYCRWEDDDIGVSVRVKPIEQNFIIDPPLSLLGQIDRTEKHVYSIQHDVDYYTKKTVSVTQLSAQAFAKQAKELIYSDLDKFVKGTT